MDYVSCANQVRMYNMNSGLLGVPGGDGTGPTPRTPEILNSLMSMTDPFKALRVRTAEAAESPVSDSTSASGSPPSVQHTRTQLIKDSLKLTIQSKRKNLGGESVTPAVECNSRIRTVSEDMSQDSMGDVSCDGLTPEDEERRRRRRERNKIAATKCRLKKRERTVNLVQESEILETQNHDLKSQIQELEIQKQRLVDMLSGHRPSCSKNVYGSSPSPSYADPISRSIEPNYNYHGPSTSFHKVTCDSFCSNSATESTFHRQQESRYCRTVGSTSMVYHTFEEVREPSVLLPYCSKTDSEFARSDPLYSSLTADSPHTFIGSQDSPNSQYRPSSLSLATSSDYESNPELLDSPTVTPNNYLYDKDAVGYPAGFPTTSSCIS